MGMDNAIRWEELTSSEIRNAIEQAPAVLVPVGSTEQHGPNLPTSLDSLCVTEVAAGISRRTGSIVAPTLTISSSRDHFPLPGNVWVRPTTLTTVVEDIVESLILSGVNDVIILNGHAWNLWPLRIASEDLRHKFRHLRIKLITWWEWDDTGYLDLSEEVADDGLHGDRTEADIVAALRPELIRSGSQEKIEPAAHFWEWPMGAFTETGNLGESTDSPDVTVGRRRLERAAERISDALLAGKDDRWEPPASESGR